MEISVIIPTYNGAHKILNLIKALEQQTILPREVIVVVDGSTDNTAELLNTANYHLPSLKLVIQENRGRAAVRNKGVSFAHGNLLLFFDDDMIPEPDCLERHLLHHQQFPNTIMVGKADEPVNDSSSDFMKFKVYLNKRWTQGFDEYKEIKSTFLSAANFSLLKSTFLILDGFDERLRDAEDYDMAVRAKLKGIPVYYNSKAFAWHNEILSPDKYIQRLRQYQVANKKLIEIKTDLHTKESIGSVVMPVGIKALFFKIFCHRFWITSIDKEYWSWLPQKLRFLLYDWIITANGSFYPDKVML